MGDFNAEVFCTRLEANVKSNQHRITELETQQITIQDILLSLKEIAIEMKNMKESQEEIKRNQEKSQQEFKESQEKLAEQLREVERRPDKHASKRIDLVTTVSISALIGGIVSQLIAKFFSGI